MGIAKGTSLKSRVTPKQRKLAAAVMERIANGDEVARSELLGLAGYSPKTIDKMPHLPFTSQGFQKALAEAGATPDKMARVVNEAMDAKVVTVFHGEAQESDAPDHAIRLRAADQLADLTGAKITRVQVQSVNVNLDGGDLLAAMGL